MSKESTKICHLGLTSNDVAEDEKEIDKRDAPNYNPEEFNGKKDASDFNSERLGGKRAAPDYRPATIEEIKSICCKDGCEIRDLVAYCNPW